MKANSSKNKASAANKSKTSTKSSIVKKQPSQIKKAKVSGKKINGAISIKEKLAGKNYSPIVEKVKSQRKKSTTSPLVKNKSFPTKVKNNEENLTKSKSKSAKVAESKVSTLPKKEKKVTKKLIEHDKKPVLKKKQPVALETVEEKKKSTSVKKVKSGKLKEEQKDAEVILGTKRKTDMEKLNTRSKSVKRVKKDVKIEDESIASTVEVKKEDEPFITKSPRQTRQKRKSSLSSIKNLKPISNIKSLAKKPLNKLSKAQLMKNKKLYPERGVCYFSHIPHGFYEKQLKEYCSQFGKVTGVYHPVSKLGNSRGYAFVEFEHKEVAEVVAETMNNYLMFNRLVKCQYIPPESQRPWIFKRERDNMKLAVERRKENLKLQMRHLPKPEALMRKKKRLTKIKSLHKKLGKLGVDYEFQVNNTELKEIKQEANEIKNEN